MRYRQCPLGSLVSDVGESAVAESLVAFACARDEDVTYFLKHEAIERERRHETRTYLVIDEESDSLKVAAFFTVGMTVVEEPSEEGAPAAQTPVFLLSQIARDDGLTSDELNGVELLANAENVMWEVSDLIGGAAMFLDCKDPLLEYYLEKGYHYVATQEETGLHRLVKPVYGSA